MGWFFFIKGETIDVVVTHGKNYCNFSYVFPCSRRVGLMICGDSPLTGQILDIVWLILDPLELNRLQYPDLSCGNTASFLPWLWVVKQVKHSQVKHSLGSWSRVPVNLIQCCLVWSRIELSNIITFYIHLITLKIYFSKPQDRINFRKVLTRMLFLTSQKKLFRDCVDKRIFVFS